MCQAGIDGQRIRDLPPLRVGRDPKPAGLLPAWWHRRHPAGPGADTKRRCPGGPVVLLRRDGIEDAFDTSFGIHPRREQRRGA
jgi:hypothetical protein